MFQRRKQETFNLAFLDVMSCGLGAVLMIFLIIKHNITEQERPLNDISPVLDKLKAEQQTLKKSIKTTRKNITRADIDKQKIDQAIREAQAKIIRLKNAAKEQQAANARLKKEIEGLAPPKTPDIPKKEKPVREQYLIGLRVEGDRIAVLVDHSASMTDERLVDIVTRKIGNRRDKMVGPKWQRTRKVAGWILARLPQSSKVSVIGYNNVARPIGNSGWLSANNKVGLGDILKRLNQLVPEKATNLDAALKQLRQLSPPPTDIYLITDGLPTKGNSGFSFRNIFRGCASITGKSTVISGKCRLKLFISAVQNNPLPYGAKLNVILLPIEGDPEAAPAYWRWAATSGGIMITPGEDWP